MELTIRHTTPDIRCTQLYSLTMTIKATFCQLTTTYCFHCQPCSCNTLRLHQFAKAAIEVATPYAPPLSSRGYYTLTWRSHGHSLAETTSQVGSYAVAVTSPGKSIIAAACKGRGIGRGNFYRSFSELM